MGLKKPPLHGKQQVSFQAQPNNSSTFTALDKPPSKPLNKILTRTPLVTPKRRTRSVPVELDKRPRLEELGYCLLCGDCFRQVTIMFGGEKSHGTCPRHALMFRIRERACQLFIAGKQDLTLDAVLYTSPGVPFKYPSEGEFKVC